MNNNRLPKRILIVDDEPDILFLLKQHLEKWGYEVSTATQGFEALNKIRKEMPDLIILDLMLPGLDGFQITGMLKRDRRYNKIPILMLTARAQKKDSDTALSLGVDGYLIKPFESESLFKKIEELLNVNPPQADEHR